MKPLIPFVVLLCGCQYGPENIATFESLRDQFDETIATIEQEHGLPNTSYRWRLGQLETQIAALQKELDPVFRKEKEKQKEEEKQRQAELLRREAELIDRQHEFLLALTPDQRFAWLLQERRLMAEKEKTEIQTEYRTNQERAIAADRERWALLTWLQAEETRRQSAEAMQAVSKGLKQIGENIAKLLTLSLADCLQRSTSNGHLQP